MPFLSTKTILNAILLTAISGSSFAVDCSGPITNAYGPYDYTNPTHRTEKLPRVEIAHFDIGVENLVGHRSKETHGRVDGDLDYTLRAFPNHHRALNAMARYHLRGMHLERPLRYPAECWFDRAMRFQPKDGTVRMLYGMYLYKLGRTTEAMTRFNEALVLNPKSPETHYNVALVHIELKDLDSARSHAKRAYELGHPLPGLRKRLMSLGAWESDEDGNDSGG